MKMSNQKLSDTMIAKPADMVGMDVLVAGYQDEQKAEARKTFTRMIEMFESLAEKLGVDAYDMGSASAALIAGCYAAYHNRELPAEYFKPLARQMKIVLAVDPKFAGMSMTEKQSMYHILVDTGVFLTMTQMENMKNKNPQVAAQLKEAGKEFLSKFAQMDIRHVKLDENGLREIK